MHHGGRGLIVAFDGALSLYPLASSLSGPVVCSLCSLPKKIQTKTLAPARALPLLASKAISPKGALC